MDSSIYYVCRSCRSGTIGWLAWEKARWSGWLEERYRGLVEECIVSVEVLDVLWVTEGGCRLSMQGVSWNVKPRL
jgi:hypothetical protein